MAFVVAPVGRIFVQSEAQPRIALVLYYHFQGEGARLPHELAILNAEAGKGIKKSPGEGE